MLMKEKFETGKATTVLFVLSKCCVAEFARDNFKFSLRHQLEFL